MTRYTKKDISDILRNIYNEKGFVCSTYISDLKSPTMKVIERLFGGLENACLYSDVPYMKRKPITEHTNNYKGNRVHEKKIDKNGTEVEIIEYYGATNIIVKFNDSYGYKLKTNYSNWKKNNIKNPYYKSIYKIACIGNATSKINGVKKYSYRVWYAMIQRCYKEYNTTKKTYKDVFVCNEWLCYENFEKWFEDNYYVVNNEVMNLDKDILIKGNRIYSPETCCFVPRRLNILFVNTNKKEVIKEITDLYIGKVDNKIIKAIYENYIYEPVSLDEIIKSKVSLH